MAGLLSLNTFVLFDPITAAAALMNKKSEKQSHFSASALALTWVALLLVLSPSCTMSCSSLLVPSWTAQGLERLSSVSPAASTAGLAISVSKLVFGYISF